MRGADDSQFSVKQATKNRLDRYKVENKEKIIARYEKSRRIVTNDDVINFLLDRAKAR